jgi:hypothetical protein
MTENQYDILEIDEKIRLKFTQEKNNLPSYVKRLADLEDTSKNEGLSFRSRNMLIDTIKELRIKIDKLHKDEDMNFYTSETAELLEKYKEIVKKPIKMSFMGKPKQETKEKDDVIYKYLEIAQKYYNISFNFPETKHIIMCENCYNKKAFVFDENLYTCLECGAEQNLLQYTSSYKDIDRVNISTRYTYDRKVHFRDCINQYQGTQNCTIAQKVYDDLEEIFKRHHLLEGDKNTPKDIRFAKITKEHILMFLKELKYSKHYENVTLIHYNLTGKKPDDISHLEDKLLNDFDLLVETYDKYYKNKVKRVNFISTQYVLFQLLQRHKHPCKKEDFVILKTVDRKSFHDEICKELFERLGWNMVPMM